MFTEEDKDFLRREVKSLKSLCMQGPEETCVHIYGIYGVGVEGTLLLRYETTTGEVLTDVVLTPCTEVCT
jgi:hypothetical protein